MTFLRWDLPYFVQFLLHKAMETPARHAVVEKKAPCIQMRSILIYNTAMPCFPHHPFRKGAHA
jgi:hypothetical protein